MHNMHIFFTVLIFVYDNTACLLGNLLCANAGTPTLPTLPHPCTPRQAAVLHTRMAILERMSVRIVLRRLPSREQRQGLSPQVRLRGRMRIDSLKHKRYVATANCEFPAICTQKEKRTCVHFWRTPRARRQTSGIGKKLIVTCRTPAVIVAVQRRPEITCVHSL